jgi:hypothetical protein
MRMLDNLSLLIDLAPCFISVGARGRQIWTLSRAPDPAMPNSRSLGYYYYLNVMPRVGRIPDQLCITFSSLGTRRIKCAHGSFSALVRGTTQEI